MQGKPACWLSTGAVPDGLRKTDEFAGSYALVRLPREMIMSSGYSVKYH